MLKPHVPHLPLPVARIVAHAVSAVRWSLGVRGLHVSAGDDRFPFHYTIPWTTLADAAVRLVSPGVRPVLAGAFRALADELDRQAAATARAIAIQQSPAPAAQPEQAPPAT